MSFILKWLRGTPKRSVGLRPHRDVEVDGDFEAAYDRVLEAIEVAIGANVLYGDRASGTIEAAFGLVNNERVRCTLYRISDLVTGVRIEATYPAGIEIPQTSRAVDALADTLSRAVSP
ncbi:MAG TPA: hypothetical protein VKR05_04105 [Candidatus Cybelea sp.]|nr:hypothetical protein [Candidatus Cybelea sp.]